MSIEQVLSCTDCYKLICSPANTEGGGGDVDDALEGENLTLREMMIVKNEMILCVLRYQRWYVLERVFG